MALTSSRLNSPIGMDNIKCTLNFSDEAMEDSGVNVPASPKSTKSWKNPKRIYTPSPVKRSLFFQARDSNCAAPKSLRRNPRKLHKTSLGLSHIAKQDEDNFMSDEDDSKTLSVPFKTYSQRRDSGCLDYDENTPTASPMRSSTALSFNSCSSGDENNSDSCFSSPIRCSALHSPRRNPRFPIATSPSSSSGVSCTSPVRSPPETPPHTRKLRALTLFDTPRTPKTLMSKIKSRINQENEGEKMT
uniref:Uncharacterized protein n=1 Tax=Ciona savignyi TaxID=51511 RepID=H2YY58_CIOSA